MEVMPEEEEMSSVNILSAETNMPDGRKRPLRKFRPCGSCLL